MRTVILLTVSCFCYFLPGAGAQPLQPGFDKEEYLEILRVFSRQGDSSFFKDLEAPRDYTMQYRSGITGLDNRWDLWDNGKGRVVISIRGTTIKAVSWLENFYAAMVPATGTLKLSATEQFDYDLSDHPHAAVHAGWLLGMASMMPDMRRKIDSCIGSGVRDFIIMGHSQGGAIAYLTTACLRRWQQKGVIPASVRFKSYCSAAPKPGNLFFAYSYEHMAGNWSYTVVNSADWVPEVPMSIQTLRDFNTTNPFVHAKDIIRKQPFPKNIVMRYLYNRLDRPIRRAQRRFEKYLGRKAGGFVKKQMPGMELPVFYKSNNYMRCGNIIVLYADKEYYERFPEDSKSNIFAHHMMDPYVYLAQRL